MYYQAGNDARPVGQNTRPTMDYALLGIALFIDLVDVVPLPLDAIGVGFILELPLSAVEWGFLRAIGVPMGKSFSEAAADLIPIVDLMPWCTLAVLDRRFNVKIPFLTGFFN
jgi:hypothetical protein